MIYSYPSMVLPLCRVEAGNLEKVAGQTRLKSIVSLGVVAPLY